MKNRNMEDRKEFQSFSSKVCVVTVTYGNRFKYLQKVIDSCLKEGVGKIIVIDNNSHTESRQKLNELEKKEPKIKVIYLEENKGSAGGYKIGLEEAYKCKECEFILCLDDDNMLSSNSLKKLYGLLTYLENYKKDELMLQMYRSLLDVDRKVVEEGKSKSYKENSFLGFNFFYSVKNKLINLFGINKKKNNILPLPLIPIQVASMGGLFFHKEVINKIGYPNESFFVYADDHEYTYRFVKKGGKIFLCSEIIVKDLDLLEEKRNTKILTLFRKDISDEKIFYGIRNHTYLSKYFIKNKFCFYGNMIAFSLRLFLCIFNSEVSFSFFVKRYKLYIKAVLDGLRGKLGKKFPCVE